MSEILVIDDDRDLLELITDTLSLDYEVTAVSSANEIDLSQLYIFDLIILDIMMPEVSGLQLLKQYRSMIDAPVIFLTALAKEEEKVEGFALGGDDYITKPFSLKELRARVAAHLRREERTHSSKIVDVIIWCDVVKEIFYVGDQKVALTSIEFQLAYYLLKKKGQTFSQEHIYNYLFGYKDVMSVNATIAERVKSIRKKFAQYNIYPIQTVWGMGYRWEIKA